FPPPPQKQKTRNSGFFAFCGAAGLGQLVGPCRLRREGPPAAERFPGGLACECRASSDVASRTRKSGFFAFCGAAGVGQLVGPCRLCREGPPAAERFPGGLACECRASSDVASRTRKSGFFAFCGAAGVGQLVGPCRLCREGPPAAERFPRGSRVSAG